MSHSAIHPDPNAGGHDRHGMGHMDHMGNLKQTFFISLALAVPIIILSPMMGLHLPFQFTFSGSDWVVLALATVLFLYGGRPFLTGARVELHNRAPAMMTLISLGISVAYFYSLYAFARNKWGSGPHVMDFFWELATLIVIMLLGHWIEMNAVGRAGSALEKMAQLLPGTASLVLEDGSVKDIPLRDLHVGAKAIVKPGGKVPADGAVIEGATTVNESMVTGEAREVAKTIGDPVIGGSINGSGAITMSVTATGESGYLAQVMQLVAGAQQEKSRAETLSDRVARALFYVAVMAGVAAFAVWFVLTRDLNTALERMVTVLVIACPHALGLAVPLVVARSISLGAQNGLLIRKRPALEAAAKVNAAMMDKTGTLTEGRFSVSQVESINPEYDAKAVLGYAAALERHSNHPLSVSIVSAAEKGGVTVHQADNVVNIPGAGLHGTVDGKQAMVVSHAFLREKGLDKGITVPDEAAKRGDSVSFVVLDNVVVGLVAQGDQVRPEGKDMVGELKRMGIRPIMLTGDNRNAAVAAAYGLGIDDIRPELRPEDKERVVREYQLQNKIVMMVGDGVNDAPSLSRADVGVAIGAGTDVAVDSADIVLVRSDPADIPGIVTLARNSSRKMVQNLWWGAGYNIVAIPLAAGVLAPWGIVLSPAMGAILMSLSTVVVALNALTLHMGRPIKS